MKRFMGFTLLELLVAITVFGVMSAIAYRGLVEVAISDDALKLEGERLKRLQFAFGLFERDVRQSVPRGIRDGFGQPMPALIGTPNRFSMTRAGWSNPMSRPRASLERVDYQFDGGQMLRLGWPVLDRAQSSQPESLVLVEEIDLIRRGGKQSNDSHVAHFYHPPDVNPVSVMPSYPWFYEDDGLTPNKTGLSMIAYVQWLGSWEPGLGQTIYDVGPIESVYPPPAIERPAAPAPPPGEEPEEEEEDFWGEEE